MRLNLFALAAVAMLGLAACKSGGSYELKFDPQTGSKYRMVMTTSTKTSQEIQGNAMEMDAVIEMTVLYEIGAANAGNKELTMTFEKVKSSQKANGEEMEVDTDKPDSTNPAFGIFNALKGSAFVVNVNNKGEVASVKGVEEMMQRLLVSASGGDSVMGSKLVAGMQSVMNEDILKNMIEQSLKIFPDGKVATGDSWKKDMTIKQPLPMNIASTYTLKDVSGSNAKLDVSSTITPGQGGMQMMGMTIETDLSGTQKGSMELEAATGMVLSSKIHQDIAGKMKAGGMEIPMKLQSDIEIKSTKL